MKRRRNLIVAATVLALLVVGGVVPLVAQTVREYTGHLIFRPIDPEIRHFGNLRFPIGVGATFTNIGLSGTLSVNTTSTASASTSKSTLLSYSLPARVLSVNGRCVDVRFWGTAKATANNKTQTIDFGSVTVSSTGAVANNAGVWSVEALVCRTGLSAQTAIGTALSATTPAALQATATEAETAAIVIAGTATNVTDADGTIAKGLLVKVLNGTP